MISDYCIRSLDSVILYLRKVLSTRETVNVNRTDNETVYVLLDLKSTRAGEARLEKRRSSTYLGGEQNHSFARTHVRRQKHARTSNADRFYALQRSFSFCAYLVSSFLFPIGLAAFSLRFNGAVDPI